MKGLYTAGTLLGLTAMLGGGAFAAKPAAKAATPKTTVKATARPATKPAAHTAKSANVAPTTKVKGHGIHAKRTADIGAKRAERVALARYHGKVVAPPMLQEKHGHRDYAVRLMSGKTAREVKVDATTGRIESSRILTASERGSKHAARPHAMKSEGRKS